MGTKKFKLVTIFLIGLLIVISMIFFFSKKGQDNGAIPSEVAHKKGYVRFYSIPNYEELHQKYPGYEYVSDFKAGIAWMQTINLGDGKSQVEIDWLKLYVLVDGQTVLLLSDEYDGEVCGGLYTRSPWFRGTIEGFPCSFENGALVLHPNEKTEAVYHWWNCERALIPENAERIWIEARIKITGKAIVQAGIDYWRDLTAPYAGTNVNNVEAAASDWCFEKDDWQIISVCK